MDARLMTKREPDGRISRNQRFDREQIDALFDERDDLRAENERLREALQRIVAESDDSCCWLIAEKALKQR